MATEKGGQTAVLYQWCRAWCNLATAVVQLSPAHHSVAMLLNSSPTAILTNRPRHPTLIMYPCWNQSTLLYNALLPSPLIQHSLPNTSSNKHHSNTVPPSQVNFLSTLYRPDSHPCSLASLDCRLRHDYSALPSNQIALCIRHALPQDGLRLDGCLGQDLGRFRTSHPKTVHCLQHHPRTFTLACSPTSVPKGDITVESSCISNISLVTNKYTHVFLNDDHTTHITTGRLRHWAASRNLTRGTRCPRHRIIHCLLRWRPL
jgi:hypothetical protein